MNGELFRALEFGEVPLTFEEFQRQFPNSLKEVTFRGDTPLHIAARKGNLELVQGILGHIPSLAKSRNKDGNTPLHEAAKSSNLNVVECFLRREDRSDYLHYNKFRETPLVIASQYGRVEIVERLLVPEARLSEDLFEWDRSLQNAAYRGYEGVVKAMLNRIPSQVNIATILHTVVQGGHLVCVRAVLNHRSWQIGSMKDSDECGRCAVHVTAMKGLWNIIDEFMNRMPDSVEIRSSDGKSVLHFAVEHNQIQLVRNLLANRTEDKAVEMVSRDHDGSGNTALHIAAEKRVDPELLDHLLPYRGDNINVLNDEGKTALDIASEAAQDNPNCVT
ncbi:hypothetical protein SUGI_0546980 [Cryptomeria japonica]|nr:hypothetical protein SUGI_0546980 [Cryptomeria japonica]